MKAHFSIQFHIKIKIKMYDTIYFSFYIALKNKIFSCLKLFNYKRSKAFETSTRVIRFTVLI